MHTSIFLILTLFSAAFSTSCDGITELCSTVTCPSTPAFQVNSFTYSPSDFNLISFGSVTINHGDVEGRVAVQNDFNAPQQGVSIGYSLPSVSSPSYSLVAGGNVNWVDGEIYPSGSQFFVGGNFTGAATLKAKASASCQSTGCLNDQFTALSQYASSLSASFAGLADTASATLVYQQLVLNCSASSNVYVVGVAASVFSSATSFSSNGCDENAVFLFNIMGSGKVTFQGHTFTSNVAVYNLPMATSVEIDTFVYGDIIAPEASLGMSVAAGTVTGQVIAKDVTELIQVNMPMCPNQTTTSTGVSTGSNSTGSLSTSGSASTGSANNTSGASTGSASTGSASTGSETSASTGSETSTGSVATGASSTTTSGVPSASSTTTSGVPSSTSTGTSTTGGNGSPICTFLDDQASCPNVANALNGNFTFNFAHYDVIVFGDLTANSGDIEGRTFASGNVNFPNGQFSLGLQASSSNNDYTLIAGGLNFVSGSINRGRAFVAGSSSVASYLQKSVDGPCTNSSCLDTIKSEGQSCYSALSATFAAQSNAALAMSGSQATLNCNSNSDSVYYINVDSSAINAASWGSSTNCNSGSVFVFNIGGSDDFSFSGAIFPTDNVVYNVQGSRTVTIGTSVHGVVLAPQSNIVMNSGLIVGKVVAASATVVQINIVPDCVNTSGSGAGSPDSGSSTGMNLTPSLLVMLIALFIAKMF